ncbi:MAG TPA: ABC transporter ATP-binding protein [Candidatus Saccharimonadales bacterium]
MAHKVASEQIDDFLRLFGNNTAAAIEAIEHHKQAVGTPKSKGATTTSLGKMMISIESLTKTYRLNRQRVDVLKDISLNVQEGEFIAITGASGSGKSTLLQLMGGLDTPSSGRILINGVDINHLSDAKRSVFRNQTIGFVFQFFYLQPFLQLADNVAVPGMFAHSPRQPRQRRVSELLQKVGLGSQEKYLPGQLSGGQIQRAAIARALLNSPKVLLADEPTGNLDSTNSKAIIDLFKRIRDEFSTTVVVVTHNPGIAAQADREIRLHDGVIA